MAEMTKGTEAKKNEMQVEKEKLESVKRADAAVKTMHDFTSPEVLYKELINSVLKYHPSTDISMIEKAYKVASEAHEGQKRKSGEPYIIHPLCVAIILADLELDKETIVAGLLHDAVEDTWMTYEEVEKEFGSEVALLVDGVTKLGQLSYSADKVEVQAENLRKMFLAMAKDIRVILIKLADRLHNMRTLQYMRPEKQQEKARETMDIYAPIAMRLGISKIKVELDDLSLKYLKPDVYYDLVEKIALRKSEREQFVGAIVKEVKKHMEDASIKSQVDGRVKHFFSIYKKMVNQDKTIDQIYDLFAVRILVDTVKDCYAALGVIHEMYKPIPGRFKDYIAMPKPNMYQSLHTTLIGPNGQPFEIQIRTYEMHRTAEYGIAAHWKYKESSDGKAPVGKSEEEKLNWLRQILEWQRDMSDNKEFMSLLKNDLDLFADSVYCFTPQGDVKTLPSGSTPVDFAYSVHSAVGNKMVGARVNGKLVPIEYEIKNGDRIEIITSQNSQGPSRDWLKLVKSTQAKNKINQWFNKELKEDKFLENYINEGKDSRIAVVHIDGNNMAKRIAKQIENIKDYTKAVNIMRKISHNIKTSYNDTFDKMKKKFEDEEVLPNENIERFIRKIIVAGDDITYVCNAHIALETVRYFSENIAGKVMVNNDNLEELDEKEKKEYIKEYGFSICAGIAYIGSHFPFYIAYEVAEECCSNAKKVAKAEENRDGERIGNYVDFQICKNIHCRNLDRIRQEEYCTPTGENLLIRPYYIPTEYQYELEKNANKENDYTNLKKNIIAFSDSKNIPRSYVKDICNTYSLGKYQTNTLYSFLKSRKHKLPNGENEMYRDINGKSTALWYDAVEIMDYNLFILKDKENVNEI